MIGHIQAIAQLQAMGGLIGMEDIEVTLDHYAPPQYRYVATFGPYDLDCEYGRGRTALDAIIDLLDQNEES